MGAVLDDEKAQAVEVDADHRISGAAGAERPASRGQA